MRLRQLFERQDDIAQDIATDYNDPRSGLTIPNDVANFPVFVKNPKHGIVAFSDQNVDGQDATALQKWLNTFGYKLDTDGVFGPATSKALHDLFNRTMDGEIQDPIVSTTTGTVGVDPETGELVTYGTDQPQSPQVDKDSIEKAIDSALDTNNYKVLPNGDVVWPDGSVSPSIKSDQKSSSTAYYLDKDGNLVKK